MEHWILVDHGYLNLLHLEATISAESSKSKRKRRQSNVLLRFYGKHLRTTLSRELNPFE